MLCKGIHDVLIIVLDLQRTERLRESLHFIGSDLPSSHVVFVDDGQAVSRLTSAQHFNTPAELLDRCHNRPTNEQLSTRTATSARYRSCNVDWVNVFVSMISWQTNSSMSYSEPAERIPARAKRRLSAVYRMLSADTQRTTQLRQLSDRLELQKLMMGKGRKRRVSESVVKWKRERKR